MNKEIFINRLSKGIRLIIIINVYIYSYWSYNQNLSATLLDLESEPIEGVKVFYDKSTISTYTNGDGVFEISIIPENPNPTLVFYHPNYKIYEVSISDKLRSTYYLETKTDDIAISNPSSTLFSAEEMYQVFRENFLGRTGNTKKTNILNKEFIQLRFDTISNKFSARAQPLQIQNNALGYHIEYYLEDFEIKFSAYSLQPEFIDYMFKYGYCLFKDIDSTKRVTKRRQKAFEGTINHFFKKIINEDYKRTKYNILVNDKKIKLKNLFDVQEIGKDIFKLKLRDDLIYNEDQEDFMFYIQQYYKNQASSRVYYYNEIGMPYYKNKSSRVLLLRPYILVDENGNPLDKDYFEISSEILEIDLAELLPLDYNLNKIR